MKLIKVVVACTHMGDGPGLMPVRVWCTQTQYDAGEHYDAAKDRASAFDYGEPYVAIDEHDHAEQLMTVFDWDTADTITVE